MNMMKSNSTTDMGGHHHTTFFWGNNVEVFFSGWPGKGWGIYAVALIVVLALSILKEGLSSYCRKMMIQLSAHDAQVPLVIARVSFLRVLKIGVAYLVMLAVMSCNVGVFLAAVAGHFIGFSFFGSFSSTTADPDPASASDVIPSPPAN